MTQSTHYLTQKEYNNIISLNDDDFTNKITNTLTQNLINSSTNSTEFVIDDTNNNTEDEQNLENINIDDYKLAEEEIEYAPYVDILNIFNIYFKMLYGKNNDSTLLDDIDQDDPTSTNRAMEKLYEEIFKYKSSKDDRYVKLYDPTLYKETYLVNNDEKLPEDYPFYMVDIDGNLSVTHNLVTALMHIASFDWKSVEWSINQINEF